MSAANALWSSCMKDAGFSYMTPQKAAGNERWQHRISTEEIATAKADVACKQKTNVIGISVALERAYQQGLIDRNRLRLGPLIKDQATLIKSVDAVIRKAV